MNQMVTTDYDGCGRCLVGVRRLSRKSEASSSPEKQEAQVLSATESVGGHIIAWADDWEVSGATDPLTRPGLGPWLRGEAGPYSGIVGAAVDRIGRNQRDVLNTAYMIHESNRLLITYGHDGPWDLNDANDEMRLSMESFGAQMELRAIQKRNREETERARKAGQPKQQNRYGYRFIRLIPTGKVDHVEIDPDAAKVIRNVARRILADETGQVTVFTESARLNREGVPSPADYRAVAYGRKPKGSIWKSSTIMRLLTEEGSLGYLMHKGRPVIGPNGHPVRLAPPLWDHATRDALIEKTATKQTGRRAQKGTRLLSGLSFCGKCGVRLYVYYRAGRKIGYACTARLDGVRTSQDCKPAPSIQAVKLDKEVEDWFLAKYGHGQLMQREFDPGTGYASRIAELEADRKRLRADRSAGLYDSDDDAEWYRHEYARMGREIGELKKMPERPPGMRMIPTGKTVADEWNAAHDDAARRELLNGFDVRVTVFSTRAEERVQITGADIWPENT
ncbi:recombinase family protein [Streptomyces sp. NPDC048504]|uniref:recombinase family protein n=1 Tax=Streptomyces sp. NPDC048504 TaxID=3365559 RepID=UPI0037113F25